MTEIKRYEMNHKGLPDPDDKGVWVLHEDNVAIVSALQEQVQKLAAENAVLKDAFHPETVPDDLLDNFGDAVKMDGETFWEGDNCTSFSYVSNAEELIKLSLASMGDIETPCTDAVIREIRAQAVDDFGIRHNFSGKQLIQVEAKKYAASIRAGEQP